MSCTDSVAVAAVEQLGLALAVEQLMQPAAEGAARQPTAAAAALSGSNSSSSNSSSKEAAEQLYGQPAAAATTAPQQQKKGPNTVHCKISKIVVLIKGNAPKKLQNKTKIDYLYFLV